jgi:hypothetical protein
MRQINGEESDGCERENAMLHVPNSDNKKKELLTVHDI